MPFKTGQNFKGVAKMDKMEADYSFTITSVKSIDFTFTQVLSMGS